MHEVHGYAAHILVPLCAQCSSCGNVIPYCVATGCHMTTDDWCLLPCCQFPTLYSEMAALLQEESACPMCSQPLSIGDLQKTVGTPSSPSLPPPFQRITRCSFLMFVCSCLVTHGYPRLPPTAFRRTGIVPAPTPAAPAVPAGRDGGPAVPQAGCRCPRRERACSAGAGVGYGLDAAQYITQAVVSNVCFVVFTIVYALATCHYFSTVLGPANVGFLPAVCRGSKQL